MELGIDQIESCCCRCILGYSDKRQGDKRRELGIC